jgi:hypothetical protein
MAPTIHISEIECGEMCLCKSEFKTSLIKNIEAHWISKKFPVSLKNTVNLLKNSVKLESVKDAGLLGCKAV